MRRCFGGLGRTLMGGSGPVGAATVSLVKKRNSVPAGLKRRHSRLAPLFFLIRYRGTMTKRIKLYSAFSKNRIFSHSWYSYVPLCSSI